MKNLKKILLGLMMSAIMTTGMVGVAFAERVDWSTYYTGPGAAYPTDVVYLTYKNTLTNYVKATSVSGTNSEVVVSGDNVNMYDIPTGKNKSYKFTPTKLSRGLFRPVSKSGTISKGKYKCVSRGDSTYYSNGYLEY